MSAEDRIRALDIIGKGDERASGSLSQSGPIVFATAALTMDIDDLIVRCDSTDGAFTVILPSVSEARGRIYDICLVTDGGDITITDKSDDAGLTDITLDTANDFVTLISNGSEWRELASEKA